MNTIWTITLSLHVLCAAAVIVLVLIQHGKGADMGAAFGSGSSGSLFGATGSANFLSRTTAVLAAVFFATSLGLTYVASQRYTGGGGGLMDSVKPAVPTRPADSVPGSGVPSSDTSPSAAPAAAPPPQPNSNANGVPK